MAAEPDNPAAQEPAVVRLVPEDMFITFGDIVPMAPPRIMQSAIRIYPEHKLGITMREVSNGVAASGIMAGQKRNFSVAASRVTEPTVIIVDQGAE